MLPLSFVEKRCVRYRSNGVGEDSRARALEQFRAPLGNVSQFLQKATAADLVQAERGSNFGGFDLSEVCLVVLVAASVVSGDSTGLTAPESPGACSWRS